MASEIQNNFQDEARFSSSTRSLAEVCFFLKALLFIPNVKQCIDAIISLIWSLSKLALCSPIVMHREPAGITSMYTEGIMQKPEVTNMHNTY